MVVVGTTIRLAFVHLCAVVRCSMSLSFVGHSSVVHIAVANSLSDLYYHRLPFVEACCAAPAVLCSSMVLGGTTSRLAFVHCVRKEDAVSVVLLLDMFL